MGLTDLTEMEVLEGLMSLISVLIATIVGLKITFKYSEYKRKEFITAGLSTILMMSGLIIHALSFITYLLFDYTVDNFSYFLISLTFVLMAVTCWVYTISIVLYPNSTKKIIIVYSMVCLVWEIFLIYFLITDIKIVGIMLGKFDIHFNLYGLLVSFFALTTLMITMSLFTYKSIKSDDLELQWRGRFLMIAAISFLIGTSFDVTLANTPIMVIIARLIVIISTFFYYIGWLLPVRLYNWLNKRHQRNLEEVAKQKGDAKAFLKSVTSRPEKLTEQEITFFRERKICLVCKGKVLGFDSFICECDALYCENCARALSNLENACWVCNTPFDKSKPSRPFKIEEKIKDTKTSRGSKK